MKTILTALATVGLSLFAITGASAQSVTLEGTPDGVEAHYRGQVASPFVFADPGIDRSDWDLSGLQRNQTGASDAVGFILALRPDSTEAGRGYIALARVGEGYVVYGPALAGADATLSLAAGGPASWTAWPSTGADGYVYFGPTGYIQPRPGRTEIAAPDMPSKLRHTVFTAFADALAFYEGRFGPLPQSPTLVVTMQGAGPSTIRADVTDTGVISARLNGEAWRNPSEAALSEIDTVTFHETAHLWNSHFARPAEGSPWLHEGGAQYLALVAAVSTGHLTEAAARESLGSNLTDCRNRLGTRDNVSNRMVAGSAVYDCGVLVQWLADMELRQASSGAQGIVDRWAAMIDAARNGQALYNPQNFRSGLNEDSAVTLLFDGPAELRWKLIEARLIDLGVAWINRPSDEDYLAATLSRLNMENCAPGSSTGFYVRDGFIQMDNASTCGALSDDLEIGTVEGFDPLTESHAMFEAVQSQCAARGMVHVVRRNTTQVLSATCNTALAEPIAYALTQSPAISVHVR
ncbi:MAG TPA: hypothetical protein DEB60_06305 [Brevundimonas sp.]|nr:hypothetical protein [Brevundimonas sp.]